jgi:hypothetical protein
VENKLGGMPERRILGGVDVCECAKGWNWLRLCPEAVMFLMKLKVSLQESYFTCMQFLFMKNVYKNFLYDARSQDYSQSKEDK